MATARIDAAAVYRAADAKWAEAEKGRLAAKEAWFAERLSKPVKRGMLWWKHDHYRPQAELEARYTAIKSGWGSAQYYTEREFWKSQGKASKLRDVAKAALQQGVRHSTIGTGSGDGFVTLDADEVLFLGLERKQ